MEKRTMLTFSAAARAHIELAASVLLLALSGKLLSGFLDKNQTEIGGLILLIFAGIFVIGGVAGLLKSIAKIRKQ